MTEMNERISAIGVVPVIKLNHPERDAANLGKALCVGGVPVAEITCEIVKEAKGRYQVQIRIGEKQTKIRVRSWSVFCFTLLYNYRSG